MKLSVSLFQTALLCLLLCVKGTAMQITGNGLTLEFSPQTGGLSAIFGPNGHAFMRRAESRPLLWRLTFRRADGSEVKIDNAQAEPPTLETKPGEILLHWSRVDLPEEKGAFSVRVSCRLSPTGDTAQLRLWVNNRSRQTGLWGVQFPVIAPVSETGKADIAIGRGNWGELYAGAAQTIAGEYPSHNMPMQFMLLLENDCGLYLATHDPGARHKQFSLTPGGEFHVNTWAENMGKPGNGWNAPYAFALGAYRGDWMDGCKRYRAWALKSAPWTKKGSLAKRSDVPEAMKKVAAWIVGQGEREQVVPVVRKFAQAVGAPVGVHWYNWHQIPFDTDYPAYFPTKPGFAQGVAELKREGVVVMPYINARLWDIANREFPQAKPYSVKDLQGSPIIEEYGSGAKLSVMCPTQAFWQERVAQIVRRLQEECGVNAVYLDQIASAPPRLCFDPAHRHTLGSGRWWVDGYRQMLTPIKRWAASAQRQVGLTTENDAEPYMDNVDAFLTWTPREQHEIPMTTAVYSGYTLYFASNRALAGGDTAFALCQARDFVWGTQLGWEGAEIVAPEHAAKLEFQGRLARLRAIAGDYLVYGELLAVLRPHNALPDLTGRWNTWQGDREVTLKAVHAALWRGKDGSYALLLANADTRPHPVSLLLDADRYGMGKANRWSLLQTTPGATVALPSADGRRFPVTVEVPARDGIMIVIKPSPSKISPLPRITVRNGQFVEAKTGKIFRPRGFNYIRTRDIGYLWHDTFNPNSYRPQRIEAALSDIAANGFNTVRVFIDHMPGAGSVATNQAKELSPAYMANVCDFLARARRHRLYVIFAMCYLPPTPPYRPEPPAIPGVEGGNLPFLHPGYIAAKARYIADFAAAIARHDPGLLTTVFAYEVDNESHLIATRPPFSTRQGSFTFQNKTYALDSGDDLQRLADAAAQALADACFEEVRRVDPEAMLSVNVFTFAAVGRTGPGHLLRDATPDERFPVRPLALTQTRVSYLDIHLYSTDEASLERDLKSIEWEAVREACQRAGKPILMGECGVFKAAVPSADRAADLLTKHIRRVLERGFVGFLHWTYDTDEQADIWNARMENATLFRALIPVR
jgi:hypothetical protein